MDGDAGRHRDVQALGESLQGYDEQFIGAFYDLFTGSVHLVGEDQGQLS